MGPGEGLGETHGTRGSLGPRCASADLLPAQRGALCRVVTLSLQATHRSQAPTGNVSGLSPPTLLRFSFSDIHRMINGMWEGGYLSKAKVSLNACSIKRLKYLSMRLV